MTMHTIAPSHFEVAYSTSLKTKVKTFGGGGWTRTNDLRIMSRPADSDPKVLQQDTPADRGKLLQNPQLPRNKKEGD